MSIVYGYGSGIYLNITNRCPCKCIFCVRNDTDALGDADSLWISSEPSAQEVMDELRKRNMLRCSEIVFCGYGEPTERFDLVLDLADRIKRAFHKKVRIDTNGMGSLINGRDIVPEMKGLIDSVSVSLNAPDEESYLAVTRNRFGKGCYSELLKFIEECRDTIDDVQVSVVSGYITEEQEERCRRMAEGWGVRFRSR